MTQWIDNALSNLKNGIANEQDQLYIEKNDATKEIRDPKGYFATSWIGRLFRFIGRALYGPYKENNKRTNQALRDKYANNLSNTTLRYLDQQISRGSPLSYRRLKAVVEEGEKLAKDFEKDGLAVINEADENLDTEEERKEDPDDPASYRTPEKKQQSADMASESRSSLTKITDVTNSNKHPFAGEPPQEKAQKDPKSSAEKPNEHSLQGNPPEEKAQKDPESLVEKPSLNLFASSFKSPKSNPGLEKADDSNEVESSSVRKPLDTFEVEDPKPSTFEIEDPKDKSPPKNKTK